MINENEIFYNYWETPLYNKESKLIYYIILKYELYNYLNYINLSNYLNNILIINQYIYFIRMMIIEYLNNLIIK